jgi:succinate dehydrogenase flavin-adding protein (antitoxin of CptAB toxin-antitoxin module)
MGNQESGIDTLSIKKVFDGISEKYTNRYSKILDANQLAKWTEMENSRKQTEFKNLLSRILATLKDLF